MNTWLVTSFWQTTNVDLFLEKAVNPFKLLMLNFLTESIENGTDAELIHLDFAKAFDSVLHNRLICKLHDYGISGNPLLWIRNFLSHRRQQVQVNLTLSNWENVTSGVPQVSI